MDTKVIHWHTIQISEIVSNDILIRNTDDAIDIMANAPSDFIVLREHNFEKDFFDLSTKKLGDVLQKFSNYHVRLAILGDFSKFSSESLKAFIYESNKHGDYLFVSSLDDVKNRWK